MCACVRVTCIKWVKSKSLISFSVSVITFTVLWVKCVLYIADCWEFLINSFYCIIAYSDVFVVESHSNELRVKKSVNYFLLQSHPGSYVFDIQKDEVKNTSLSNIIWYIRVHYRDSSVQCEWLRDITYECWTTTEVSPAPARKVARNQRGWTWG